MNRVLKFRVWDKLQKYYLYSNSPASHHWILDLNGRFCNLQNGSGGDEYVVQQFTGLSDKNGVDIYEGDICIYKQPPVVLMRYPEEACEVYWADTNVSYGWMVRHKYNVFDWTLTRKFANESLEVVGNIFENPELLS